MLRHHGLSRKPTWLHLILTTCLFAAAGLAVRAWRSPATGETVDTASPSSPVAQADPEPLADSVPSGRSTTTAANPGLPPWPGPATAGVEAPVERPVADWPGRLHTRSPLEPSPDAEPGPNLPALHPRPWNWEPPVPPGEAGEQLPGTNLANELRPGLATGAREGEPDSTRLRGSLSDEEPPESLHASSTSPPDKVKARIEALDPVTEDSATPAERDTVQALPGSAETLEPQSSGVWPKAPAFDEQLQRLAAYPSCTTLVANMQRYLQQLRQTESLGDAQAGTIIRQLDTCVGEGQALLEATRDENVRTDLARTCYSLARRLIIWNHVHKMAAQPLFASLDAEWDRDELREDLKRVDARLQSAPHANAWREYLMLDPLAQLVASEESDVHQRRALARQMLSRMESPKLTAEQQRVLDEPAFDHLRHALRVVALEPVDHWTLLERLETYEQDPSQADAADLARWCQILQWSPDGEAAAMARDLESHYRNANVRVAVSEEMLNRLLPDPNIYMENVRDRVMGVNIWGTARTSSRLRIVLVPDRRQWRLDLEAQGEVESEMAARKGPATLFNQGVSSFRARKPLFIDRRGVRVFRAEAGADSQNDLTGVRTEVDGIPFLGALVRSIAIRAHSNAAPQTKQETEYRVADKAREVFDQEVHQRLTEFEQSFDDRLLTPLRRLQLKPSVVDMETTQERLIVRYRLAGDHQLAAHTARPQAPSDSLISVQIHETAFNNTFEQLELAGRRVELRALYKELMDRFDQRQMAIPDDIPEGVMLRLAPQKPLQLRFADGRASLTIRVAELSAERMEWNDFAIRVHYKPDEAQEEANLIRDGVVEVIGERLSGRTRLPLRAIFSKVFNRSHTFNVVNEMLRKQPKMQDLHVNQFAIADGWIGVAVGPTRPPAVEPALPAPETATQPRRWFQR